MQQETMCKRCGNPIERLQGRKPRVYCRRSSCRQLASRATQRAKRRQLLREQWKMLPIRAQEQLETLASRYGDHAAEVALDTVRRCFSDGNYHTFISLYRMWNQEE